MVRALRTPDLGPANTPSSRYHAIIIITNTPKSKILGDLFGGLSFMLIQSNAKAILARSGLACPQS